MCMYMYVCCMCIYLYIHPHTSTRPIQTPPFIPLYTKTNTTHLPTITPHAR